VEAIDSGLVTMRRSTSPAPWFRAEDSPETMTFPAGDELVQRFAAEDFLAAHLADDALLATRFRLSPDSRLDQQLVPVPEEGGWGLLDNRLRRTVGLHWSGYVDADGADLLARCDGTRTMTDLLAELAGAVGPDSADLQAAWPATVRRLVACGFLLPA
jgi:hypothetical protein